MFPLTKRSWWAVHFLCLRWCLINLVYNAGGIENMIPASARPKKEAAHETAPPPTPGKRPNQKQSRLNSRTLWKQSQTRQGSPEPAPVVNNLPQHATELSFSIKRALGARWDFIKKHNKAKYSELMSWLELLLVGRDGRSWQRMVRPLTQTPWKPLSAWSKRSSIRWTFGRHFETITKEVFIPSLFFIHLQITQLFLKPQGLAVPERITIKVPWRWWFKHYLN